MAEPSTVARPYAEAAFRLADGAGALGKWSEMLGALARVVADDARVRAAVAEPGRTDAQVAGIFIGILAGRLNGEAENFLRVLAENGRLGLLPEIRAQFEALKDEREGVLEAEVHSAFELLRGTGRRPGAAAREENRPQGENQGPGRQGADRRRARRARRQGHRRLGARAARRARSRIEGIEAGRLGALCN